MDNTPPAAAPTKLSASAPCGCRAARCPHCGAGGRSEMVERHLHNLALTGAIGVELAGQIRRELRREGVLPPQAGKMSDQITRAVRRAHALEAKFDADSRKTEAQWAADWARAEAATLRASRPGKPEQAAAAPAKASEPRKRDNLLDDLPDRDDTLIDLEDFEDFEDSDYLEYLAEEADEASLDEGDIGLSPAASLDSMDKSVAALRKRLAAAAAYDPPR